MKFVQVARDLKELDERLDDIEGVKRVMIDLPWGEKSRIIELESLLKIVKHMVKLAEGKNDLKTTLEEFSEILEEHDVGVTTELAAGAFDPRKEFVLEMDDEDGVLLITGIELLDL